MSESTKLLDERMVERARLRKTLNIFQKTTTEQEALLESDRRLVGRKLKIHLENLDRLYSMTGKLRADLEAVQAEIQLLTPAK